MIRRRKYLIKKGLQSSFIFAFSLSVVVGFLINWAIVYHLVDKGLAEVLYKSHIQIVTTGEVIGNILFKVNLITVPLLIVSAVITGFIIVRKVIIPLTGFKEAIEDLERGDLSPKILKDIPRDLAICYQTMAKHLSKTFSVFKTQISELEKDVQRLETLEDKGDTHIQQKIKNVYKSILENRKLIEQELSKIKV